MADSVRLAPLDEATLERLLHVAMTDATPADVMAPMPGDPGWTDERVAAFLGKHRGCRLEPGKAPHEVSLAVLHNGAVAGSVRFGLVADRPQLREIGLWLSRSHRGQGVSTRVVDLGASYALDVLGARELIADTSSSNDAAVAALGRNRFTLTAQPDGRVRGVRALGEAG